MDDSVTHQQTAPNQPPNPSGDSMKALIANAMVLEACGAPIANIESSDQLRELLKKVLPAGCNNFSAVPIAPGGRFEKTDRYLIIWSSVFEPQCPSLPLDSSERAVNAISQATGLGGCSFSMRRVTKRERDGMVVCLKKLVDKNSIQHEPILRSIQEVFGQPAVKPQVVVITSPLPVHTEQKGTKWDAPNALLEGYHGEVDMGTGGNKIRIKAIQSILARLAINGKRKGPTVTIRLVQPPPGHPTTSVLRPVPISTPLLELEKAEDQKSISPLEYSSNIGNAEIVHAIYTEARSNGTPRTKEDERARRERACAMALKEVQEVAKEVEWHRKGRGYEEGPWPSEMGGVEFVPDEEKRKWIAEKRETLRNQWSESCLTVWDNNEAADHIWAVIHALWVCNEAGKEGVEF